MADNFLERQRRDYEARKQEWLRKKKQRFPIAKPRLEKPEDEAL
ncbi:MAG: dehydrogenase [Prevotella sp.]|jgi:hypothetical protein|nr:dehydrogenase [Prevotella sp.]